MSLESCLPAHLQGPDTTITPIAMGFSGAGVYRVDAAGQAFVLKVAGGDAPADVWRRRLHIQRLAGDAGLAPRTIHADEARRAVVSEFVTDRGFPMFYGDPRTHETAVAMLGRTLRRVHDLPLPPGAEATDPLEFVASTWSETSKGFVLPGFVADAVQRVLTDPRPDSGRAPVLSHNDVNPSNMAYDGEKLVLLDWDAAGTHDPLYDLATVSVFFRMDEATVLRLLAAYEGEPVSGIPARLTYFRRLVAVLAGAAFLNGARKGGHAGATAGESMESAESLGDFYQRMRAGAVSLATPDGQWAYGLALIKSSYGF